MKNILILCCLLIGSAIGSLYAFPGTALKGLTKIAEYQANYAKLNVAIPEGYQVSYYDNQAEDKPTLVLLHGITGLKENWLKIGPLLNDYRIIAPDFLGHGKTTPKNLDQEYLIQNYVTFLHSFLDTINVKQFTLVGNSLGGAVAGLYAHQHPDQVTNLILINNAGIDSRIKTPAVTQAEAGGQNPYVVKSVDGFKSKMEMLFHGPSPIPAPLINHIAGLQIEASELHQKLFDDLEKTPNAIGILEPILDQITQRTLVIWGEDDEVLHVSSLEKMEPLLKHESVKIIQDSGHVPMVEHPEKTAKLIKQFLSSL